MLYSSYKDNIVYNSQPVINFPRSGVDPTIDSDSKSTPKSGESSLVFLMCPNRRKTVECLNDPKMNFSACLTKRVITDSVYRTKIGTKNLNSLERSKTDRFFMEQKELPISYIPEANKNTILSKRKNLVFDMSRWMEIIFAWTEKMSAKKKCKEFMRILAMKLNDPAFSKYSKLLVFDVNTWSASVKNCVIMNKKLLNNPLSILLYVAVYFPDLMKDLPDVRLMIVNRNSGQIYFIQTSFITKKNYPIIKQKLSAFKSLVFSVEDDVNPTVDESTIDAEVKAEVVNGFKEDIKQKLRYNLLGGNSSSNPFDEIDDITGNIADPFDSELEEELKAEEEKQSAKASKKSKDTESDIDESLSDELGLTDEISAEVDEVFETIEDVDEIDPSLLAMELADKIKTKKYKAAFMPTRSKAELAKIERLTAQQSQVLELPSIDDVKRKSISTSTTGGFIKTSNPHILESKFVNFDKEYAEKCLEKNIDDSVAQLSQASGKIFVTGKSKKDSSDPQNLKQKYTYNLVDEKGNRMTVSFDVPTIIDGSYVYLNGTKKNIRHQFILKPIVKTSPDTVQLVTAYNKVFIRREGNVNQNINRLQVFMEKNPEVFNVKTGNCSMRNGAYEVPLDFAMLSRYFAEFTVGDVTFFMAIDTLLDRFKKIAHKEAVYDATKELPIGINTKKKEVLYMKLTDSYTDILMSYFTEDQKKKISAIKRKPKFVMATAKMLKRVIPLVLFMMYCEGFSSVMRKANIDYQFVDKKAKKQYDPMKWDAIELSDGFLLWEKTPFRNELLMNGFKKCDLSDFAYEDLESKDTFISLILPFYPGNQKIADALDNYRDFLLDAKAKEILTDLGYPTDLVELLVVAAGMLTDTSYIIENNLNNMRIRSNEVIADLVYIAITNAYKPYRSTSYKKKPTKLSIKKSAICDALLDSDTNMIEESSTLNPVLELEKQRSVTFKGIRGIQLDRAMTLPRRCYDNSMLGTVGISTSADANCGVVRELTLEPNITSTYGYIDTSKSLDEMSGANLFIASELLQPMGVMHDDPDRTSIEVVGMSTLNLVNCWDELARFLVPNW